MTQQPVMRLETIDLLHFLLIYPQLAQGYLCKQGQHDRRCWGRCRAFVPWDLLVMGKKIEADLSLDDAVHQ